MSTHDSTPPGGKARGGERAVPETGSGAFQPIFVARQPIFDWSQNVRGYELLFRHSREAQMAAFDDDAEATAQVLIDGYSLAAPGLAAGSRAFINFPRKLLLEGAALAMPKDRCTVEVLETVSPSDEVVQALKSIKAEGYEVALDDVRDVARAKPLLGCVDIVKLDMRAQSVAETIALGHYFSSKGLRLLAEKVETCWDMELANSIGCTMYQGYYFSRPEVLPGRTLSTGELARILLLQELAVEDFEYARLESVIKNDLSLCYRLLRYINSVAVGMRQKVKSIAQAMSLMGGRPLRQWLMVAVLSDANRSPRGQELLDVSVRRGRFLELLCQERERPLPDCVFLLGLFSKLDALFNQPFPELLAHLPLEEDLSRALLGEESPYGRWLELVETIDSGHWERACELMGTLEIEADIATQAHNQAAAWTRELLRHRAPGDREGGGESDSDQSAWDGNGAGREERGHVDG